MFTEHCKHILINFLNETHAKDFYYLQIILTYFYFIFINIISEFPVKLFPQNQVLRTASHMSHGESTKNIGQMLFLDVDEIMIFKVFSFKTIFNTSLSHFFYLRVSIENESSNHYWGKQSMADSLSMVTNNSDGDEQKGDKSW